MSGFCTFYTLLIKKGETAMRRVARGFFILCAIAVIALAALFVIELWQCGWSFDGKNSKNYTHTEQVITEDFTKIIINLKTDDISVLPSEDGECRLETFERKSMPHTVKVEDGTLVISFTEKDDLYSRINPFRFTSTYATLYLPGNYYDALTIGHKTGDLLVENGIYYDSVAIALSTGDVTFLADAIKDLEITTTTGDVRIVSDKTGEARITTTTGDITLTDSVVTSLDISLSTGEVTATNLTVLSDALIKGTTGNSTLKDVTARNLSIKKSTGNTTLDDVYADERFEVEATSGRVTLDGIDGGEIFIKTTTGSVKGSILSEKQFLAKSTSGRIDVPSTAGPICKIETTTGSIKIIIGN